MAGNGNTTAISEVVDPAAIEQFNALKISGKELRTELVQLLETAIKLNATLGGSTPANFSKNLQASTDATNKIIANNNKQIENEQAKAAKQEQIVNKYLVLLSKQEAARNEAEVKQQQRDAKEIAAAEAKQTKLDAIAARKAAVQFPTGPTSGYNPVTAEPDQPSVRYEPIITGQENMVISANKSTEAIAGENATLLEQREVMDSLSASYRANIELLLTLQVERAENAAAMKALTVNDAASGERMVFLTAEQLRLKTAIQQTNLTLSQQTKQMLAEDTSGAKMQARLDELRVAYGTLSKAERENIAIGGVWEAEIKQLDTAIKNQRDNLGDHTKHVGDYERAQGKANSSASGFGKALGGILSPIRQLAYILPGIGMAGLFNLAFEAIEKAISALDLFGGKLNQAKENLKALNEVQKNAASDAGQMVGKYQILSDVIRDLNISYEDKLKAAIELKKLFPEELENSTAQAIATGKEADAMDRLKDSVVQLAKAKAASKEIEKQEGEIIALRMQQDKINSAKASQEERYLKQAEQERKTFGAGNRSSTPGKTVGDQADAVVREGFRQSKHMADLANKDIQDQIKIKEQTVKYLEQYGGLQKEAESLDDKKAPKTPKPKDYANTDLLEANRIEIEEAKKRNKAIVMDDSYSHETRLVALGQYIKKSKELLDNSAEIIKADTNLRAQQRINGLKKLKNEELDIENERIAETEKLNKDEIEKHKKKLAELVTADREREQENLEILNQGAIVVAQQLNDNKDKLINEKTLAYSKGKITEREYNRDILAINDEYNVQRVAQELAVQQSILALKEGARDADLLAAKGIGATPVELAKIVSDANKAIDPTKNKIADLTNQLTNAKTKQTVDATKGGKGEDKDKRKELQEALGYAVDVTKDIQDLVDKGYENQISKLEKIGQKIQENAEIEKAAIGRSLDTQSNKARREEILAAETASKQKAIQGQVNAEKTKQARADKAAKIAEIILSTAANIAKVFPNVFLEILAGTIGATQLAVAAATPIPTFSEGGVHKGGLLIYGEKGSERIEEPGKPAYYSPGVATLAYAPTGTKITPHEMLPKTPEWARRGVTDNTDIVNGLNKINQSISTQKTSTKINGWVSEQRLSQAWLNYSNNYFK